MTRYLRGMTAGLLVLLVCSQAAWLPPRAAAQAGLSWPDYWQADPAFYDVWSRADAPIALQAASRSWLWGPAPFAVANEDYAESPTGKRLVEYTDKARMEVNDPNADRTSPWFVTSGLLVYEMVTGQVQTGNNRYEAHSPAGLPVAGDATSPDAPTYADFAQYTGPSSDQTGVIVTQTIGKGGKVSVLADQDAPTDAGLFGISYFDSVSNHNVPGVFANWMSQQATVLNGGELVQAPLLDPLYVLGRPITEPYWINILVGGTPTLVLVQLFERRALTYNPNNTPDWRVEMANVGRTYYDWRYNGKGAGPAIAPAVGDEAVVIRGWNWPPAGTAHVQIGTIGGQAALSGPQDVRADAAGRFSTVLPMNSQLQNALLAHAALQATANGQQGSVALPLAGKITVGQVQLAGTVSQVDLGAPGHPRATMQARDGTVWSLSLSETAKVRYNEGSAAPVSALATGTAVVVSGTASGRTLDVETMTLLSTSQSGAQMSYAWQAGGKGLQVLGLDWPGEHNVVFTVAPLGGSGLQLGSAQADSRGNLTASLTVPPNPNWPSGPLWLFGSSSDQGTVVAQVTLPFDPESGALSAALPPRLVAMSASGDQAASLGSYCWQGQCANAIGVPLPAAPLKVDAGETLRFRSQYGPDPNLGMTPDTFSARLFTYPANPAAEGASVDGVYYYSPRSLPVLSVDQQPGRPFSLALPPSMPSGQYALVVTVNWPGGQGQSQQATYGLTLQVP